ncbi:MAG: Rieske 2Fe-2S domain-containing protein [Albidovulum sp.]|nr:Rieske 2Fe-2S domain-containing protein [Albidovulum sp.]
MLDENIGRDESLLLQPFQKPLTANAEESFTLPSKFYTSPKIYELEKERIFYKTWQWVGHLSSFKRTGDYATVRICDQNVFVIRGRDGKLRGFYNVCQHRAHELLPDGTGNISSVIVCPYHAWSFETDGRLRGAPRSSGRVGFRKDDYSLREVRTEVFLDCAFVNLDPEAESLSTCAGDLEDDVRKRVPFLENVAPTGAYGDGQIKINAGWKVVVDNYVECYHCDHAHPAFADIMCMDSYRHDTFGLWARQLCEDIRLENSAYALDPGKHCVSSFWFLWPNTTFNVLPGPEEINISSIRPTGLDTTSFEGVSFTVSGEIDRARTDYVSNVLVPEDVRLCESVQKGLKSKGYDQGPVMAEPQRTGRGEHALHHFHRLVQGALLEDA